MLYKEGRTYWTLLMRQIFVNSSNCAELSQTMGSPHRHCLSCESAWEISRAAAGAQQNFTSLVHSSSEGGVYWVLSGRNKTAELFQKAFSGISGLLEPQEGPCVSLLGSFVATIHVLSPHRYLLSAHRWLSSPVSSWGSLQPLCLWTNLFFL